MQLLPVKADQPDRIKPRVKMLDVDFLIPSSLSADLRPLLYESFRTAHKVSKHLSEMLREIDSHLTSVWLPVMIPCLARIGPSLDAILSASLWPASGALAAAFRPVNQRMTT